MENGETKTTKIQVGANVDPALYAVLEKFMIEEDRPMSNLIAVLLKTHPRIQQVLERESESAAGVNA